MLFYSSLNTFKFFHLTQLSFESNINLFDITVSIDNALDRQIMVYGIMCMFVSSQTKFDGWLLAWMAWVVPIKVINVTHIAIERLLK